MVSLSVCSREGAGGMRPVVGVVGFEMELDLDGYREPCHLALADFSLALEAAGGTPVVLTPATPPERCLQVVHALVLGGGRDVSPSLYGEEPRPPTRATDPERDRFEVALVREALSRGIPLLGVCRGMQVINVATGGSLCQHLPEKVGSSIDHLPGGDDDFIAHTVALRAGSLLERALGPGEVEVNSLHHQGVERLGRGVLATATAPDGLVEGIEVAGHGWAVGVQWHPELMWRRFPRQLSLFRLLVQAASAARTR